MAVLQEQSSGRHSLRAYTYGACCSPLPILDFLRWPPFFRILEVGEC
jgi:hypothetical protein